MVGPEVVLKFYHVEILLRVPSFIVEIFQIHFREQIATIVFCSFERLVIKDGDNFLLSFGLISQSLPQFLVFVLPEEHPVEGVGKTWVVKISGHNFESFFKKRMQIWISCISNRIGIHEVSHVSITDLIEMFFDSRFAIKESFVYAAHSVLLTSRKGSQNVCHVVAVKFSLICQLVGPPFHTPEYVLIIGCLRNVQSLGNARELFWIGIFCNFAQVMLIMGQQFFNLLLVVLLHDSEIFRFARSVRDKQVCNCVSALGSIHRAREHLLFEIDH